MSEQAIDVRLSMAILRRRYRTLVVAALIGALAGAGLVFLHPPMYSSTSMVLVPSATASDNATSPGVDTQVSIASSDVVLGPAAKALEPAMTVRQLSKQVTVTASTSNVLAIVGRASTPERAQQISRAVAAADVTYLKSAVSTMTNAQKSALKKRKQALEKSLKSVNSEMEKTKTRLASEGRDSAQGRADASALSQLTAQQADLVLQIDNVTDQSGSTAPVMGKDGTRATVIQSASPATRPGLLSRYAVTALLGLILAVVVAAIALLVSGGRDRRLRSRDELADALGANVIGALRSQAPRTVAGWTSLLEGYSPPTVDVWTIRQALRQLAGRDSESGSSTLHHPSSMMVVALADDLRAMALAPQIASYAASAEIRTRFVAAQEHESVAALWAACTGVHEGTEVRPGLLVDTAPDRASDAELTVYLAAVDRRNPELKGVPQTDLTVFAVASGSGTAEDLARAAVMADKNNMRIHGILVADPDTLDRTTGRLLQYERDQQVSLPTRMTGGAAPGRDPNRVVGIDRRPR